MYYWPEIVSGSMSPVIGVRRLQQQLNSLFDDFGFSGPDATFPAVSVWSNEEQVVVRAEVPGVEPKDIDIQAQGDVLTIAGERKNEEPAKDVTCHRAERAAGQFSRTIRLPYEISHEKIGAQAANGVVTITLPRAAASKPKKIVVTAA